jgi:hypothetical protein
MTTPVAVRKDNGSEQSLNVLDPDLSFLAASAALELDNLLNDSASSLEHVEKLAKLLLSSAGSATATVGDIRMLIDPVSSNVLNRAILESYDVKLSSLKELSKQTSQLSESLKKTLSNVVSEKQNLKSLRDFCLSLSRLASTSRKSIYGEQPTHPYRK